ncbi:helix-turn-helix domain-containing protein [Peptoniphilus asaccharolyticus]
MSLSKNIRYLRKQKGMSQDELAEKLNYKSYTTIQKWESGVSEPPLSKTHELANIFDVSINKLVNSDLEVSEDEIDLTEKGKDDIQINVKNVPFIPDPVAAGIPDTIEGYSELPTIPIAREFLGKYANRKDLIIMRVNGESMNRIIPNGSYIGLITNIKIENLKDGDLVVFSQEYNYSLKHYYDLGNEILFKPNSTNLSFREIRCKKDERLKIVGKVIMSSLKYE